MGGVMPAYADILLHQIDPSRNRRRFYRIRLGWNLFGEPVLMREFGRIGQAGRVMEDRHPAAETARMDFCRLTACKLRRGYVCMPAGRKGDDVVCGILMAEPLGLACDLIFGGTGHGPDQEFDFTGPFVRTALPEKPQPQ
ncbi:WGR domain-containing protein [Paracoccus sp. ME4]|uniref:WGR domain-containing protein n=1 Tax=Paracoccus sp. ME4 TaxID=3138066 RepID=UPI00398AFE7F